MKTVGSLTKETFKTVVDNFGFLLAVQLLATLLPLGVVVLWIAMFGISESFASNGLPNYVLITIGIVFFALVICANSVYSAMTIYAAKDAHEKKKKKKYGEYYKEGFAVMFVVASITIIAAVLILIGLFLLVIPGLLVMYYLMFSVFVAVIEKKGIISSLSRSAQLVSQNFWPLLWRVLLFSVCYLLVVILTNFIPLVNIAVSIFAGMIAIMFMYILYVEVTKKEKHATK